MKKKLLAAILAGVMALSLVACGSEQKPAPEGEKEPEGNTEESSYKIALCMSHQTNAFTIAVSEGAKAKAKELGVTLDVFDGKKDQATQTSQVEQCINSGYDGILIEPVSVEGVVPAVKAANEANVPVITVVATMADQEKYAQAYRGGNDSAAGELQMRMVAELLGGKGNIAVLYGPMGSDGQLLRGAGYEKVLAENPDMKLEFAETANWVTEEALSLVENWLSTGTKLDAIVAQNDGMAMGALKAVEDAGLQDEILVVGVDAVSDALQAIADGRLDGTISQDAPGQGALGVEAMVDLLNGKEVEPISYTECIWITKDNVAEYLK